MAKIISSKNIKPIMVDLKYPSRAYQYPRPLINLKRAGAEPPRNLTRRPKKYWRIVIPLLIIFLLVLGFIGFSNFQKIKSEFLNASRLISGNFSFSFEALRGFRPQEAAQNLEKNQQTFNNLQDLLNKYHVEEITNLAGGAVPALKQFANFLSAVSALNIKFLEMTQIINDLQLNGLNYFQNNGSLLIQNIKTLKELTESLIQEEEKAKNAAASLKDISSSFSQINQEISSQYFNYLPDFYSLNEFLAGLLKILDSPQEHHLLVLLQNPAQIRPAGGFLHSFADMSLSSGQIANINIEDVFNAEEKFQQKIIPPQPLQFITKNWGLAQANWFFDFPLSAKKTISFLEDSRIYSQKNINFETVLALNLEVLKSLLEITGPINISELKTEINNQNFLTVIQKEESVQESKGILKMLIPLILENLQNLNQNQKQTLSERIIKHINQKDIMFFAQDPDLEQFFLKSNIAGSIYELSGNFFGSYLAVVNANINGGQSDAFVKQKINLKVNLDTDGSALNNLSIERENESASEANQNFIKIFTNPDSQFLSLKGNNIKKGGYPFDYFGADYKVDSDLEAIESTEVFDSDYNFWNFKEAGKKILAAWFNVPVGQTKTLSLSYQISPMEDYKIVAKPVYHFIFEKQSGINSGLNIVFRAPLGYLWEKNNNSVFVYQNNNPGSRIILDLALVKRP